MEIPVDDGIVLYTYWRSSAAYRVRIGLELKGLAWEARPVHLVRDGGEQHLDAYRALNPQQLVPTLLHEGHALTQSLAILEYLEERFPQVPLLPADAAGRARVRALAQLVACDIHPINNLRVLRYLVGPLQQDEAAKLTWYRHWVRGGLEAFERQLAQGPQSTYCFGNTPTLADCCLVPQIFNGKRFEVSFDGLPLTMAAFDACMKLDAFQKAQPSACPDAA